MMGSRRAPRILFSSLSAKLALYQWVTKDAKAFHPDSSVLATDCSPYCSASSKVEEFKAMPPLVELSDSDLINFCLKNEITHVLPTRDDELPYWSKKSELLSNEGIKAWVSEKGFLEICQNKTTFAREFRNSPIPSIPTYPFPDAKISQRWVVKEQTGSGSRSTGLNLMIDQAVLHASNLSNPIFQPFVEGREFSAETWIDNQGKAHGSLLRWRERVVDGESHQTTVFSVPDWESRIRDLFESIPGGRGHCLAQVIASKDDRLSLVEINPRLGGASPLALAAGLHSIRWSLLEEAGLSSEIPADPRFTIGMTLRKKEENVRIVG